STPRKTTDPVRLPTMPMIDLSVVVLPAPLRPSRVTTSPWTISRSTPCRMCDSPYHAWRPSTFSSGSAAGEGSTADILRAAASAMARPHIGLDDRRILRDRRVVALGQHLAPG